MTAEQIIEHFGMKPLSQEGGFYAETYRSAAVIGRANLPAGYTGDRSLASAILYLLKRGQVSRLHRLKSDEVFHFYLGQPVTMLQLHPDGSDQVVTLGPEILAGQHLQAVVPAGTWQGCLLQGQGEFALLGTTMAPAFEFADFELAEAQTLMAAYPSQKDLIARLAPGE